MADKKKYNGTIISGRKDETLTYSRYIKDEETGESVKQILDKKVNSNDKLESQQIKDGAITNEKLAANSVDERTLLDESVVSDKIKDGNVVESKLAQGAVTTSKIKDKNITNDKLGDSSVDERNIKNNSVVSEKIKDESIIESKIADDSVTTPKIKDESITNAKLNKEVISSINDAKDNANNSASAATDAANRANKISEHPPKVGEDGFWYRYDETIKEYVKTDKYSKGGVDYPTFDIDDSDMGLYVEVSEETDPTRFSIEDDELCITFN